MKKLVFFFLILSVGFCGTDVFATFFSNRPIVIMGNTFPPSKNCTIGSGLVMQENRAINPNIRYIDASICKLIIKESDEEPSFTIKADDNILPLIKTELSSEKLTIAPKSDVCFSTDNPIECVITVKKLDHLDLSGSADGSLDTHGNGELKLKMAGLSKLEGSIKANKIILDASGSSNITLSGCAAKQEIVCSGLCSYDAKNVLSDFVKCEIAGSAKADLSAINELNASGLSTVTGVVRADKLVVKASGSTNITLSGCAAKQEIVCSGLCSYDAKNVLSDFVKCEISGSAKADLSAINELQASGLSSVKGSVQADQLVVKASGSADVTLSGCAVKQKIECGGLSSYNAENVQSDYIKCKITGSGKANLLAKEKITGSLSGMARVRYSGNPSVDVTTGASSSIKKKKNSFFA